jgi:HsdM N-terminal domain
MPQLEHIEAIEKRLWSAADNLRANSNYASNEYFLPVMGLVFLRHAFSRYLAVKEKIEPDLPSRGGKARALTKEDFSQQSAIFLRPRRSSTTSWPCPIVRTAPAPSSRRWTPSRRTTKIGYVELSWQCTRCAQRDI